MIVGNGRRTPLAEINVTPLVDVMLVLLIVFMVTAPMLQHELDVNLPVASGTPQALDHEQVVLTVTRQGEIYFNQTAYALEALQPKLEALAQERVNRTVFLRADARVPYGTVVRVMDAIKRAGIVKLGMITQPATEQP